MEAAYVLHHRRYSDSRLILELWSENSGRIAGIFRANRKPGSAVPMLFALYEVEWRGRSELKTLTVCEPVPGRMCSLSGPGSLCGLYLNELLIRCFQPGDPHPPVFSLYRNALHDLQQAADLKNAEPVLRSFEINLLEQLGFAVNFFHCSDSGNPILADRNYQLVVDAGFHLTDAGHDPRHGIFTGEEIMATGKNTLQTVEQFRAAKWMTRLLLAPVLGERPLKSRELFTSSSMLS